MEGDAPRARWLGYSVLCLICFAAFAIVSRLGGRAGVPDPTMFFLFIGGSLPVGVGVWAWRRFRLERSPKGISCALAFGLLGGLGQWMFLRAYEAGPGDTAAITVVTGLYSVITVLLAVLLLRERLRPVHVLGISVALLAVTALAMPRDLGELRVSGFPPPWFAPAAIVLGAWGVVGVFQKVASSHISPESSIVWQTLAFLLYLPLVWPAVPISTYPTAGILWGLSAGILVNLGTLFLVAAMKNGGKASIVAPLTTLFPIIVVFVAPFLFGETITLVQGAGVACAAVSIVLLSG